MIIALLLTDIIRQDGKRNMGGLVPKIYVNYANNVSVWPTDPVEGADMINAGTSTGDFECVAGKGFIQVQTVADANELDKTGQGPFDGQSYKNEVMFKIPANNSLNVGLMNALQNSRLVIIVVDPEGKKQVIGTQNFPANVDMSKTKFTGGKKAADGKFIEVAAYADSPFPATYWTGTFPLLDSSSILGS